MRKLLFLLLAFLLVPSPTKGSVPSVVINELAWMGTTTSANDEWMELRNTTNEEINLSGWLLKTTDGKMKIYLAGKIPANGFYLLERTDDGSVPSITANQIYTGALSNTGLSLELFKTSQILIDSIAFTGGWPAGDNATKQTMERTESGAWQTSKNPGGTPRAQNSPTGSENAAPKESPIAKIESTPEQPTASFPSGVVISELLPAPEGADEENEWIEIYNTNAFEVDLSGWKIQDAQGTKGMYAFSEGSKIQSKKYLVVKRPQTKITLNNDIDEIKLIQPNGNVASSVNYEAAYTNQSYNATATGWQWSTTLTPGSSAIITTPATKPASLPKAKKSDKNIAVASIGNAVTQLPQVEEPSNKNPWPLLFIVLGGAIVSAVVILILKLKTHVRT